jgi:histidinol-phosphate/aromatic aminotransferase/cobyric acid decarboxylase-like protein
MASLHPTHGGTDAMPDPRYDFSSNANPLGPCPSVLAAVRNADVTRWIRLSAQPPAAQIALLAALKSAL